MTAMDKDVFDFLVEQFINEKLDDIMMQDTEYTKLQDEIWEEKEKCDQLDLSETERQIVENLLSLHIKTIELYGKKAYEHGLIDCVSLLQKIDVIKDA